MVQVRWDGLMIYKQYCGAKGRPKEKLDDIRKMAYSGKVNQVASKRMVHAIDMLIQMSRVKMKVRPTGKMFPFRLGFWTLTVPDPVRKPALIHKAFKRFTDWMRYRNCVYIWKAEYQERGQLHYHLIVNQYVPWVDIRDGWNKCLKKEKLLQEWALKSGHFNPHSIDVRAVLNNEALSKYLQKYLLKNVGKLPPGHLRKWWGASQTLLDKKFSTEMWSGDWEALQNADSLIEDELGRWMIVKGKRNRILSGYSLNQYNDWRVKRRNSNWKKPVVKKRFQLVEDLKLMRSRREKNAVSIVKQLQLNMSLVKD